MKLKEMEALATITLKAIMMVSDDRKLAFLGRAYFESDSMIACIMEKTVALENYAAIEHYVHERTPET